MTSHAVGNDPYIVVNPPNSSPLPKPKPWSSTYYEALSSYHIAVPADTLLPQSRDLDDPEERKKYRRERMKQYAAAHINPLTGIAALTGLGALGYGLFRLAQARKSMVVGGNPLSVRPYFGFGPLIVGVGLAPFIYGAFFAEPRFVRSPHDVLTPIPSRTPLILSDQEKQAIIEKKTFEQRKRALEAMYLKPEQK